MVDIDFKIIKEELLNNIRSADILTISQRGVTTVTETFDGNNSDVEFTLTNSGIKNIRSVKISSVLQTPYEDYSYSISDIDSENKKITFTTAPATGTDNIEIIYDYSSSGDKIYDDFPKIEIGIDNYPRIGFDIISEVTSDKSLQGALTQSNLLFSFSSYGTGRNQTEDVMTALRKYLMDNKKNFYWLNYLAPKGRSRMLPIDGTNNKVFKRSADFSAPMEFEIN